MIFKYKVRVANGDIRNGIHEAATEEAALLWIREQGWSPINVEPERGVGSLFAASDDSKKSLMSMELWPQKVGLLDKNVVFKQMATMINAGITVAATLELLSTQTENRTLANALSGMKETVSAGVTFTASMARYPKVFTTLEIALVHAGEQGGVLDVSMNRLAKFVEAQYSLQRKVRSAMTYPFVVVFFTLSALALLSLLIVPLFRKAFANIGMETLPALTNFVFSVSDVMKAYWYLFPLPFVALWLVLRYMRRTEGGRRFLDRLSLKMPVSGDIVYKIIMARSFRTFATLVKAGVPILDAIEMSSEVADNVVVRKAFDIIRERAQNGVALSATIRSQKLFPPMVGHMVAIGEETGEIDEVLEKVADWYDMELDEKIKALSSIIEPVLIIIIGLAVGLVVASVFIPLVQSMQQFM